jgi:glutaredoxin
MKTEDHVCPYGLKARHLLRSRGYELRDELLRSREETDRFKAEHDVETTPQVWIDGERIGGHDALREHLGLSDARWFGRYTPLVAIFGSTALMALALTANTVGFELAPWRWLQLFIALSMMALAMQKLRDLESFVNGFLAYDLLAQRWVPYARVYAFAEAWVGIGMLGVIGTDSPLVYAVAPVSIFIGTVGAISVVKAVWIDGRELKCACVGGDSDVPLGAISLTENLMMAGMGLAMLAG